MQGIKQMARLRRIQVYSKRKYSFWDRAGNDPTNRLADKYIFSNVSKVPMEVDSIQGFGTPEQYELNARPDVWYNNYDGLNWFSMEII